MSETTTIRVSRGTHARVTRLAAERHETIDETVGHAIRLLRQDAMAHDLARDLDENDPEALENLGLYVNYDVVASPNYVIGVRDANESTYDARVPVPAGSIEAERVFTHYFDSIGQPWVDTAFAGRSEGMAFIELGIPTAGLSSGADGSKTAAEAEMFGGTAWLMYDPNNHTLADDLSNVNVTALGIMSKAIGFTTGTFAYDTSMVNGKSSGTSDKPHPGMGKAVGQQPPLPAAKAEARAA